MRHIRYLESTCRTSFQSRWISKYKDLHLRRSFCCATGWSSCCSRARWTMCCFGNIFCHFLHTVRLIKVMIRWLTIRCTFNALKYSSNTYSICIRNVYKSVCIESALICTNWYGWWRKTRKVLIVNNSGEGRALWFYCVESCILPKSVDDLLALRLMLLLVCVLSLIFLLQWSLLWLTIELADSCLAPIVPLSVPVQPIPVWFLLLFQCAAFEWLSLLLWMMLYIRDLMLGWLISGWMVAYCQFQRSMKMDPNRCYWWSNLIHCSLPRSMMAIDGFWSKLYLLVKQNFE